MTSWLQLANLRGALWNKTTANYWTLLWKTAAACHLALLADHACHALRLANAACIRTCYLLPTIVNLADASTKRRSEITTTCNC